MNEYKALREQNQPMGVKTAGSMFKNPVGLKAWELIDKAGCRGMKRGDAQVSEKHCNFFINTGNATANDLETLALDVQKRVFEKFEIELEWEVRRVGVKTKRFSSFGGK
jgi:UDP-N-acetylmuramate dehydrogenase